eukprot:6207391-Pleurochrysis_carterae.AAC.3
MLLEVRGRVMGRFGQIANKFASRSSPDCGLHRCRGQTCTEKIRSSAPDCTEFRRMNSTVTSMNSRFCLRGRVRR